MSVALTEDAVIRRAKTVTRRSGWTMLRPGDRLTLVRKAMGRRRPDGSVEPLVRLAEVEVVAVRREPLYAISAADVIREGFDRDKLGEYLQAEPKALARAFVRFFRQHMGGPEDQVVTRIEWRYLDEVAS